MPSLSSLFSDGPRASGPPSIIFKAPDKQGCIRTFNSSNQEIARFVANDKSITRLVGRSQHIMCTFKRSSLSGTITLQIHGRKIKVKQSWEGMRYGKDVESPTGLLRWRAGSKGFEELRDKKKALLARGKLPGTFHSKPSDLEVFVPGDEFLLDLILASWISTIKGQKDESEELGAVAEVVGAVGAAGGS